MAIENHTLTQRPKIVFFLVNGTFANEGEWVKSTSLDSFRTKLKDQLEDRYKVEFCDEFSWGSTSRYWRYLQDNKMNVRLDSGEELRDYLIGFNKSEEGTRHYIIAHSHGGNVALYALKDQEVRNKIDGLICLGTPFLTSEMKPNIFGLIGFSAMFLIAFAWLQQSWLLWIYTLFYLVLAFVVMKSGDYKNSLDKIIKQYEKLRLPVEEIIRNDRPKVFAIYTPRDEAFWLLRVTGEISKKVRYIGAIITSITGWVIAAVLSFTFIIGLAEKIQLNLSWVETTRSFLDQHVGTPLLLILTGILTSVVLLRLSYAYDSAPWVASLDTQTHRTLSDQMSSKELPKDTTATRLRHSRIPIRSVGEISKWIVKQEKAVAGSVRKIVEA